MCALIVTPARLAGLQVDTALVEAIVRDARGEPGVLPLVESVLAELWNDAKVQGRQALSKSYYEQHNGVVGMLAKQADAQRWSERGGLGRWFGLAGWRDRRVFRRLRPRKGSLAGRYLARSRWVAWGKAVLLGGVLGVLGESAWWTSTNKFPIGYALIKPLWMTGLYTPLPEMVRIPAGVFVMYGEQSE